MYLFLMRGYFIEAESIGQLQKDLDTTKELQRYAESEHEVGRGVFSQSLDENTSLEAENEQ